MLKTINAVYDGKVFLPEAPLVLEPNTRVRITIETDQPVLKNQSSFLRTARSLNLDGPNDWSVNLDSYLYGEKKQHDE